LYFWLAKVLGAEVKGQGSDAMELINSSRNRFNKVITLKGVPWHYITSPNEFVSLNVDLN
jgi:hypothetical protein